MEPLAALGLASAIAQLLDFTRKILRQAKRYYSDDESERYHSDFRRLATEIFPGLPELATRTPKDKKVFFFVDGLDELSIVAVTMISATYSPGQQHERGSRFSPPVDRFQSVRFTWDQLGSYAVLLGMETTEGGVATTIIEYVTSKACGVFLWVVLVVKRLLVCLQN
ncbi:uncharacterized protein RCO7_03950 [Rhynchosporium graminicola]|uniref:Uncharacterized protein n=1 Tax=Rhynchosporium graminicola TaxID=2792576 RepID=A0A1E1L5P6_9HELO|nr:uncharacterized protein RCO7_03950 [Rhynchosporium commune]